MNFSKSWIYWPIVSLSLMAIIHNSYLAMQTANMSTGYEWLDKLIALNFALGIEGGLWVLVMRKKNKAVKMYTGLLFVLNMLYYGRGGKLNQVINFIHPEAWLYIEAILTTVLFSIVLSGMVYYLTEVVMAEREKATLIPEKQYISSSYLRTQERTGEPRKEHTPKVFSTDITERSLNDMKETVKQWVAEEMKHNAVTFSKQLETTIREHLKSMPENSEGKASSVSGELSEKMSVAVPSIVPPLSSPVSGEVSENLQPVSRELSGQVSSSVSGQVSEKTIVSTSIDLPIAEQANTPAANETQIESVLNANTEAMARVSIEAKEMVEQPVNKYNNSAISVEEKNSLEKALEAISAKKKPSVTLDKSPINKKRYLSNSKLKIEKKTCKNCGKSFTATNRKKLHCSSPCRKAYSEANKQNELQVEAA